jgi:hypothetical protein
MLERAVMDLCFGFAVLKGVIPASEVLSVILKR